MRAPDWQEANGGAFRRRLNAMLASGLCTWLFIAASLGLLIAVLIVSNHNKDKLGDLDRVVERRMQSWCASQDAALVLEQMAALQSGDFYGYLRFFSPNATLYEHDTTLPQGGSWTGLDFSNPRSIPSYFFLIGEYLEFVDIQVSERDLHNCGSDTFETEVVIETVVYCPWNPSIYMQVPYDRSHAVVTKFNWEHKIIRQDLHCDNSAITAFLLEECDAVLPVSLSSIRPPTNNSTRLPWQPRS